MTDARDFRVEHTLRNGTTVTIRAARPDDRERIAKAFAGVARESVYTRYFGFRNELSAEQFELLDTMDFVDDVMLIATVVARGETTVVANARYVAEKGDASPRTAEVAFIVEEDYQGLGIAGRLLEHLAAIARANGIDRFTADVLPGNNSMLAVFARSGLPMTQKPGDGVVHVTMALTAPRP